MPCRKHFQIFLLAFLCLSFSSNAIAQSKETREIHFRITGIQKNTTDSIIATIKGGRYHGIEPGYTGPVKGVYKSGNDRSDRELGFASVLSATDQTATISIRPKENQKIMTGDQAVITVYIPRLQYRSIFFELACLGIDFKNLNSDPLYTFDAILYSDSKKMEDSLLNESAKDVISTAEWLGEDTSFNHLKIPITSGRYAGRSCFDVMMGCGKKDILTFLNFVKGYPGKYIGNSWKINETFATWVINNAPYNKTEIFDSVVSYKQNPAALKKFIERNRDLIIKDEYVRDWISDAINAQNSGDKEKADFLLTISRLVIPYLKDESSSGFYYYAKAQVLQNRDDFKKAILHCDSAMASFLKAKDYRFYIESHYKKAYCLRQISRQDEALAIYDKVNTLLNDPSITLTAPEKANLVGKLKRETGNIWNARGEYKKAIGLYIESIGAFKSIGSYSGLTDAAAVEESLAEIYKKQGEYSKALEIYDQQLNTYRTLNNSLKEGTVLDDLGYIQTKLGDYRGAIEYHKKAKSIHLSLQRLSSAGHSQSQIGQCLWNLGKYDSAIDCHLQAIGLRKQAGNYSGQAYSWKKLASLYKEVGKKDMALASYDSTAFYYELAKDSTSLIENLIDVGDVYDADKQGRKAFEYFYRAHQLNLSRGNKSSIVTSYFKMGGASYSYDTALSRQNYLACYKLAEEIGDKSNMLYSSLNLGLLYVRNYDYLNSESYFRKGLQLSIEQKSKSDEAYAYEFIGLGHQQKMELDDAFRNFQKSITIYDSLGERSKLPNLYSNLGSTLQSKGDFENAIKQYERSKGIAYEIKNMADVASVLQYLSFAYAISGDPKKSLEAADSSLAIYRELNNNWQMGNSYLTLGNVYNGISDYQKAIRYYMLADSLYSIEKDDWSKATAMNNIGNVYYHQADNEMALKYFLEADKLHQRIKVINESILLTRVNIGETYFALKNFPKAKDYLLDAYKKSAEKSVMRIFAGSGIVLAKIALAEQKLDEAKKFLDASKEPSYKLKEANKIIEYHLTYGRLKTEQKQSQAGIEHFRTAVEYCRKTQTEKYLWEALYELGLSFYNQDNYDSATVYFKQAVDVVEAGASKLFGGAEAKKIYSADVKKVDLYNKLVASLAKLKKTEEALYYANQSNSQAIKEKLEQSGIVTSDKEKTEALKKGGELLQKQTAIEKSLAKEKAKPEKERNEQLIASLESIKKVAEEDYLNFIDGLIAKYPELGSYFLKTNPAEFRNYIQFIPDSTLVVLYVINDKQLYIFTVTNQETAIKIVELKDDINKHAMRLLGILKNPENVTGTGAIQVRATIPAKDGIKGDFKTESSLLYDLLITPIQDQLKDKKQLCIIPNGGLSYIPFATLGKPDESNRFRFLIEEYCLFYVNNVDVFSMPYTKGDISTSFVAFGNPDKSLPGASLEVNNIKDLFPNTTIYLEEAATEGRAKASLKSTRFVHFATHGILNNNDFSQSYLLLNADEGNDGKLTLAEIKGLIKGETDMIFLSACEMAVPKELGKGWEISVLNAFLNNRVRAAAGGLWQVPDEATTIWLDEYHKNIKKGMTKAEACRRAQAVLSQDPKYAHPFFWGAFVMYGQWK